MDFQTYEAELAEARRKGAEMKREMINSLKEILHGVNSYDKERFNNAVYSLNRLLMDLGQ